MRKIKLRHCNNCEWAHDTVDTYEFVDGNIYVAKYRCMDIKTRPLQAFFCPNYKREGKTSK